MNEGGKRGENEGKEEGVMGDEGENVIDNVVRQVHNKVCGRGET